MTKTRLTRRGKIVVGIIVAVIIWWLNDVTMPDECKVPIDQMSQFCIDLRYS